MDVSNSALYLCRMKPQLTPPTSDSSPSRTSASPLSPSSGSQGVKRPHEEVLDPTAKRPRGGRWNVSSRVRRDESQGGEAKSGSQDWTGKPKSNVPSSVLDRDARNGRHNHRHRDGHLTNGTTTLTPPTTTVSSTSLSPARKPSASPINQSSSPRRHINGLHPNDHSSGSHSPINGVTNGLTNGHATHHSRTNGHATPPSSSPDSLSGDDAPPDYLRYRSILHKQRLDFCCFYLLFFMTKFRVQGHTKQTTKISVLCCSPKRVIIIGDKTDREG